MEKISGNLQYDIAKTFEKYENDLPVAKELINLINNSKNDHEITHILVGGVDALLITILNYKKEISDLKEAMTHPLILNALINDAKRKEEKKEKNKMEVKKSQNIFNFKKKD